MPEKIKEIASRVRETAGTWSEILLKMEEYLQVSKEIYEKYEKGQRIRQASF